MYWTRKSSVRRAKPKAYSPSKPSFPNRGNINHEEYFGQISMPTLDPSLPSTAAYGYCISPSLH